MAPAAKGTMSGVVAATFTPLTSEGEINLSMIEPYIDYLINKQNVKSVFVNGTTGESVSLSLAERKALAENWCQKAKGKMDQARHAAQIRADGIAVISPSFFKPGTADDIKAFLREVASAAPNLPFYYYHIPAMTGVNVPVRDVLNDIEDLIPSFRGIKFSGTYNYLGSYVNKLITAFENGDHLQARAIQFKLQALLSFAMKNKFDLGVNKQLMSDVSGLSLGPPRLPLVQCPQDYAQSILQKYHSLFKDDCQ